MTQCKNCWRGISGKFRDGKEFCTAKCEQEYNRKQKTLKGFMTNAK
jgi:hypothetical protein